MMLKSCLTSNRNTEPAQTYMTYHEGAEELVVLDTDHVLDVFTGNGAPALDDAIAESVDRFKDTLRIRRW